MWPPSRRADGLPDILLHGMAHALTKNSTVSAASSQVSSTGEGEVVILDVSTGVYYGLDPVGGCIWQSIQSPRTISDIHREMVEEFDVDADRGERDLLALLRDLADASLIEVRD